MNKTIEQLTNDDLAGMTPTELAALCPHNHVGAKLISGRLGRGWTRRRAITTPLQPKSRKVAKSHPFKKFSTKFYSADALARLGGGSQ